ncbi:hypothetical protein [Mastigocoleus testarum]|uniref:hypothetical protein n=1 Tax=Mastigocoleus testarum TaxID=996925 RepID=UPI00128EF693|nr:hypothetical protein [Mastigocoleus testarum]
MKSTSTSVQTCLLSEPGDSKSFGYALAISDRYLAVGDPEANRVLVYSHNRNQKWLRTREILPPKGSAAEVVGSGFGYDISLDKSTLVVGAYTEKHKPNNQEIFQYTNQLGVSFSGGVYKVLLDKKAEVKRIDALSGGEISGFSVSADGGRIAFSIKEEEEPGGWIGKVNLLTEGNVKQIFSPTNSAEQNFGVDIDLKNNLLLVGSTFDDTGAAWLFDLETSENKPQRLAVPNAHMGSTVAISDQFAVVGAVGGLTYATPPKTLIKGIKDGSRTVIDGVGKLSLDKNTLARMRPPSSDGEQQALLELFNLDDIATPRLVKERRDIDRALLQNSLLTTVQKTSSGVKLCIEQHITSKD